LLSRNWLESNGASAIKEPLMESGGKNRRRLQLNYTHVGKIKKETFNLALTLPH
jgi:hypothetical protein